MAIYTKTGDKGETSLLNPDLTLRRVAKSSKQIAVIGTIDELNSALGVTISFLSNKSLSTLLTTIQTDLFTINSILAGASLTFDKTRSEFLEDYIDEVESHLPPLKNFILPGGGVAGAHLHWVRTVARRAERKLFSLSEVDVVPSEIKQYINRLSDMLFMMAREVNFQENQKETPWIGKPNK